MSFYGNRYGSSYSYRYTVDSEGVVVDTARKVVVITAKYDGYGKDPITAEFPLLLLRTCKKCGAPISIYARGSVATLRSLTGEGLFAEPSEHGEWKHLQVEGGFALVADSGHAFTRHPVHGYRHASCSETDLKVAFQASE